jgi:hypothetical protein
MLSIAERKEELYKMLRQWGWLNTGLFIVNRILSIVSRGHVRLYKYHLIAQPVAKETLVPQGRGKKIEIRLIQENDEIIKKFPRPAAAIQSRFKQGAKCLVALKEGEFAGFLWLLMGSYQEDEVRARYVPLPPGRSAWDFDVYVAPPFRLGLTFMRLWDHANRMLNENGISWSCSRISAFNTGSLGAHARLGILFLGSAIFFCAGRWQITLASIHPFIHLSTRAGSFPEFQLDTGQLETIGPSPTTNQPRSDHAAP